MAGRITYLGNIITDGLLLNLDAGKKDSYSIGSTIWRDIASGIVTGSLLNGPTFVNTNGGSISFDGTNDQCNLGDILFTGSISNACTIDIWLINQDPRTNRYFISKGSAADGAAGSAFYLTTGGLNQARFTMTSTANIRSSNVDISCPTGSWSNLTYTYDGSTIRSYRNTVAGPTASLAGPLKGLTQPIRLANDRYSANGACQIASFKIYNRVLSTTEITRNYNALLGRFGL